MIGEALPMRLIRIVRLTLGIIIVAVGVMAFVNSIMSGMWEAIAISAAIVLVGFSIANVGEA